MVTRMPYGMNTSSQPGSPSPPKNVELVELKLSKFKPPSGGSSEESENSGSSPRTGKFAK